MALLISSTIISYNFDIFNSQYKQKAIKSGGPFKTAAISLFIVEFLPDNYTLIRCDVHLIVFGYTEGGIPLVKVSRRYIRSENSRAVNVN